MAYERSFDLPQITNLPACVHLRSKAMYVTGQVDPQYASATVRDEAGASAYCWCNLTQHVLGPDNQSVARNDCVPGRDCYRASH